ncbi:hypothetical protein C5167_027844 [Papaver somniferum]|nr:hypothetical protein C5167_027844 [Papaver somniferum]
MMEKLKTNKELHTSLSLSACSIWCIVIVPFMARFYVFGNMRAVTCLTDLIISLGKIIKIMNKCWVHVNPYVSKPIDPLLITGCGLWDICVSIDL